MTRRRLLPLVLLVASAAAVHAEEARTVRYGPRDIITIHCKIRNTTTSCFKTAGSVSSSSSTCGSGSSRRSDTSTAWSRKPARPRRGT